MENMSFVKPVLIALSTLTMFACGPDDGTGTGDASLQFVMVPGDGVTPAFEMAINHIGRTGINTASIIARRPDNQVIIAIIIDIARSRSDWPNRSIRSSLYLSLTTHLVRYET